MHVNLFHPHPVSKTDFYRNNGLKFATDVFKALSRSASPHGTSKRKIILEQNLH
jgi:hypothetical protein